LPIITFNAVPVIPSSAPIIDKLSVKTGDLGKLEIKITDQAIKSI